MSGKVRVAIIGAGNCASSFVQGVQYYRKADVEEFVPGLMHVNLGGYHISDIEFTAAFDIDKTKVGKDLSEALHGGMNCTPVFCDVPHLGVPVYRGMTHDGLGKYLSEVIEKAPGPTDDIVGILKDTKTDVVVNYLPVGSEMATKWYVEQVLEAGCAFVNCIPVFIAREEYWQSRFIERGLPVIGDDIKSQVGATIVHRVLARLMRERGVRLERTASSTSAATPTSSTCWKGSAWRARRSPRPTRCPPNSITIWAAATYISVLPITWSGSTTASGRTSAWRGAPSVMYHSISS